MRRFLVLSLVAAAGLVPTAFAADRVGFPVAHAAAVCADYPNQAAAQAAGDTVAADRRARLLEGVKTKSGYDRDEYPPALYRGFGTGLTKGMDPTGWRADVAHVPSRETRSRDSTVGLKLRRLCSGTKFRYVFN